MSIKNDGHYFCRAGGNRPDGLNEPVTAREHGINDNLLFKWRQYWREGKLRPPSTTENNVPELLPITLDAEDVVPTTSPRSQPVAAATPESLNISCEVTFRHGSLRLNGAISENILNLLIRELKR
ncbi:transposase [Escherichia coli]|uniref:transposase n=1 Tax=Escherichia coli TaxID=562 RepID=UPI0019553602|nr:transposase [Escherichia coli]WKB91016.1 transposase [Escherichia coli]